MESNRRLTRAVALILGSVIYSFFLLDIFPVTLKFVSVKKKMIFFYAKDIAQLFAAGVSGGMERQYAWSGSHHWSVLHVVNLI